MSTLVTSAHRNYTETLRSTSGFSAYAHGYFSRPMEGYPTVPENALIHLISHTKLIYCVPDGSMRFATESELTELNLLYGYAYNCTEADQRRHTEYVSRVDYANKCFNFA